MSERVFDLDGGITGTQYAAGAEKGPRIQIDSTSGEFISLGKDEAENLATALLRWVGKKTRETPEIYFQDYKKSFELSLDCPRCDARIELFSFSKRLW